MTATRPQALISSTTRAAAAFAVAGLLSAVCLGAAHESRHAVEESSAAMSRTTLYVTLPPVEIVASRKAADTMATAAVRPGAKSI